MSTVSLATPAAGASLPRRMLDVFVSPGTLFHSFRESTPWVGPLAVAIAIGIATQLLIPEELFVSHMEEAAGATRLPPDANPETIARISRVVGTGALVVVMPLVELLQAGVLMLVFTQLLGGEARMKQYLAILSHSMLIPSLGSLVVLPIQLLRRDLEVSLSLSLLTPFLDPEGLAFAILRRIDIFTLWWLVVVALGIHLVNRRPSWGTATAILMTIYLVAVSAITAFTR